MPLFSNWVTDPGVSRCGTANIVDGLIWCIWHDGDRRWGVLDLGMRGVDDHVTALLRLLLSAYGAARTFGRAVWIAREGQPLWTASVRGKPGDGSGDKGVYEKLNELLGMKSGE